jgi:predicted TIM-barrel fold metal-dependent hydrolase
MTSLADLALTGRPLDVTVIDSHGHVGPARGIDRQTGPDDLVRLMDRVGVERTVISGLMFATGVRVESMNDWVEECLGAHPDRFLGYCYINPNFAESIGQEIERCFEHAGFAGFKLHVSWNGVPYDSHRYAPVYEYAAARRLPILAHTWGDESVRALARTARQYPAISFLAGHSGAGDVEINLEEARRTPNLFLELTYSGGTPAQVARMVREVGADRIVWGSDTILFAASHQLGKVVFADITEAEKAQILGWNAERIFGLE